MKSHFAKTVSRLHDALRPCRLGMAVLGLAMIGASCPKPTPSPPVDTQDASAGPDDAASPDGLEPAFDAPQEPWDALSCPSGDTSPCGMACARMCQLGCEEGRKPNCSDVCKHIVTTGLTAFDPACMAAAQTAEQARKCPAVKCR